MITEIITNEIFSFNFNKNMKLGFICDLSNIISKKKLYYFMSELCCQFDINLSLVIFLYTICTHNVITRLLVAKLGVFPLVHQGIDKDFITGALEIDDVSYHI